MGAAARRHARGAGPARRHPLRRHRVARGDGVLEDGRRHGGGVRRRRRRDRGRHRRATCPRRRDLGADRTADGADGSARGGGPPEGRRPVRQPSAQPVRAPHGGCLGRTGAGVGVDGDAGAEQSARRGRLPRPRIPPPARSRPTGARLPGRASRSPERVPAAAIPRRVPDGHQRPEAGARARRTRLRGPERRARDPRRRVEANDGRFAPRRARAGRIGHRQDAPRRRAVAPRRRARRHGAVRALRRRDDRPVPTVRRGTPAVRLRVFAVHPARATARARGGSHPCLPRVARTLPCVAVTPPERSRSRALPAVRGDHRAADRDHDGAVDPARARRPALGRSADRAPAATRRALRARGGADDRGVLPGRRRAPRPSPRESAVGPAARAVRRAGVAAGSVGARDQRVARRPHRGAGDHAALGRAPPRDRREPSLPHRALPAPRRDRHAPRGTGRPVGRARPRPARPSRGGPRRGRTPAARPAAVGERAPRRRRGVRRRVRRRVAGTRRRPIGRRRPRAARRSTPRPAWSRRTPTGSAGTRSPTR